MIFHKNLSLEKWNTFPGEKKILLIASEFSRAQHLAASAKKDYVAECFERSIELIELCYQSGCFNLSLADKKVLQGLYETEKEIYRIFGTIKRTQEECSSRCEAGEAGWRKNVQENSQKLYDRLIQLSENLKSS